MLMPTAASTIRTGYSKRVMRVRSIQPVPRTMATALDR